MRWAVALTCAGACVCGALVAGCSAVAQYHAGPSSDRGDGAPIDGALLDIAANDSAPGDRAVSDLPVNDADGPRQVDGPRIPCDVSENELKIADVFLGGIAFDPVTGLAYAAGVTANNELQIFTIAACEAKLRLIATDKLAPSNFAGASSLRTDVTLAARRLCVAGGAQSSTLTSQLFVACLPLDSVGKLSGLSSVVSIVQPMNVERVAIKRVGTSLAVLADSGSLLTFGVQSAGVMGFFSLGDSRLGGIATRVSTSVTAGYGSRDGKIAYQRTCGPTACLTPQAIAVNGAVEVGGFATTPTFDVWLGTNTSGTGTSSTIVAMFKRSGNVKLDVQAFQVQGRINAALAVGNVVHAVGHTEKPSPLVVHIDMADPGGSVDDQDWDSGGDATRGELVGLDNIYGQALLHSGSYGTNAPYIGTVQRCPLSGCATITP